MPMGLRTGGRFVVPTWNARSSRSLYGPLVHVEAEKLFLDALEGTTDPEAKRKTIGKLFIEVL